ncbi:MAG: type VI secretion system tip protein VgrG, partial [Glaciimonas sp.]|nr:type VI secretion system tip protein VgrG [Glaciimonas sp.]
MSELLTQLAQLAQFGSATRLYALTINSNGRDSSTDYGSSGLQVEAFAAVEGLHSIGARDIIVLSTNAHIPLKTLLGRSATLQISLSDGTRAAFTGLINEAALLGSEGGFARYRVRLVPWPWLLTQSRSSRVWQDKTVIDIIESIFREYSAHAAWQWSSEVAPFMTEARTRSYVAQYRESNFDFVSRLLSEEGLSFRIEESTTAPSGHQIVLFADTTQKSACPEDATSSHALGGHGIRFHAGTAREEQDSIQALSARRTLQAGAITLLSYDYKTKKAVTAHIPTHHAFGGKQAPLLESYDSPGPYAYANSAEALRYGQLHMQAHEARNKRWYARSTVRTLRPGTTFDLTQGPLNAAANAAPVPYTVLRVASIGINNLPKNVSEGIAELFGPIPQLLEECMASCTAAAPASAVACEDGFADGAESGFGFGFESDDNN